MSSGHDEREDPHTAKRDIAREPPKTPTDGDRPPAMAPARKGAMWSSASTDDDPYADVPCTD